jgi:hypothetical protein
MGLARYALAFGLGFAAGHPTGREKLRTVPGRVATLAQRPEAQQLRDRGRAAAGQVVQTAKDRLGNRSTPGAAAGAATTTEPAGGAADTATRNGRRPLGRRRGPVVAQGAVVAAEKTPATSRGTDTEAATHGTLPPSTPR